MTILILLGIGGVARKGLASKQHASEASAGDRLYREVVQRFSRYLPATGLVRSPYIHSLSMSSDIVSLPVVPRP